MTGDDRVQPDTAPQGHEHPDGEPTPDASGHAGAAWALEGQEYGDDLILFRPRFDQVRNPRTGRSMRRLVLESPDWVNVVALTADDRVVMVSQHRFGIGRHTLETPGGMVDPGESPRDSAARELLEETGFGDGRWRSLGAVEPNPAIHGHLCHHWFVEGVRSVAEPAPGPGEDIRILCMTVDAVRAAIRDGHVRHALALSALSRVPRIWGPTSPFDPPAPG